MTFIHNDSGHQIADTSTSSYYAVYGTVKYERNTEPCKTDKRERKQRRRSYLYVYDRILSVATAPGRAFSNSSNFYVRCMKLGNPINLQMIQIHVNLGKHRFHEKVKEQITFPDGSGKLIPFPAKNWKIPNHWRLIIDLIRSLFITVSPIRLERTSLLPLFPMVQRCPSLF